MRLTATLALITLASAALAGGETVRLTRASLAKSAEFVVTYTLTPKNGSKETRSFRVEVSGDRARLDYSDAALGPVRYLVNEKGVFFYIPANKAAQKMEMKGGIDQALNLAFAQVLSEMKGATKSGSAQVSGQPTDVYKNLRTGTTIYIGKNPGFRLPVKMETNNEGGTVSLVASSIRLNAAIAGGRFALPAGTQVIESKGTAAGLPGVK